MFTLFLCIVLSIVFTVAFNIISRISPTQQFEVMKEDFIILDPQINPSV